MKIMISHGMNGKSEEDILREINRITEKLNDMDIEVAESYFEYNFDNKEIKNIPVMYLAKSIEVMADVNAVLFCNNWEKYRGCRIEHHIAKEYGIKILYEDFLDNKEQYYVNPTYVSNLNNKTQRYVNPIYD